MESCSLRRKGAPQPLRRALSLSGKLTVEHGRIGLELKHGRVVRRFFLPAQSDGLIEILYALAEVGRDGPRAV